MMAWLRAAGLALISRRSRATLSIGMVVGISVVGTLALWSNTVTTESGTFTTATINILANGSKAATFDFAPTGLLPGQSAAKVVTITNTGSAPYSYAAMARSTDALGQAMTLTVVAGATASATGTCGTGTSLTTGSAITASTGAFVTGRGPIAATSGSENLCLQLTLPTTAAATLAGTSGAVVFTFTASAGS